MGSHAFPLYGLHQAVKTKQPEDIKKARALWAMKEVKDRKEEHYDPNCQNHIQEKKQIRLGLWEVHL